MHLLLSNLKFIFNFKIIVWTFLSFHVFLRKKIKFKFLFLVQCSARVVIWYHFLSIQFQVQIFENQGYMRVIIETFLFQWYKSPDFDFFPDYFKRRLMLPQESLHLLHPHSLWNLWRAMQKFIHVRMLPNPPSSGFLGELNSICLLTVTLVPFLNQSHKLAIFKSQISNRHIITN